MHVILQSFIILDVILVPVIPLTFHLIDDILLNSEEFYPNGYDLSKHYSAEYHSAGCHPGEAHSDGCRGICLNIAPFIKLLTKYI